MNDEEIKVSELDLASEIRDTDQIMIVQGGINKKALGEKINDRTISDSYGESEHKGYSQKYQNEHNVIVSPTQPTTSERVWFKQGKNLFDKNTVSKLNAYFNVSTPTITSSDYNRTLYIPCKTNTTYSVTIPSGTGAFAFGYTTNLPAVNVSVSGVIDGDNRTLTTDVNAKYLVLRYFQTNNATITEQQALNGIQIEEGSTATTYEEYIAPSINVDGEEIYSKPAYASYQGTATSSQTISGTTATTINGLSVNINTNGKPLCIATGFLAKTANASYTAKVKVFIDDTEKVNRLGTIISTNDIYYPLMIVLNDIPAGNHTIDIKVEGENANSSITFATWYTRYLNVWEM